VSYRLIPIAMTLQAFLKMTSCHSELVDKSSTDIACSRGASVVAELLVSAAFMSSRVNSAKSDNSRIFVYNDTLVFFYRFHTGSCHTSSALTFRPAGW